MVHVSAEPVFDLKDCPESAKRGIESASVYTWNEIESMASYGSLFLHHLRAEAQPLYEGPSVRGRLYETLCAVGPYRRGRRDLAAFGQAVEDVEDSVASGGDPEFELAELGRILRHGSILGCYLVGQPTFGRSEAFQVFGAWLGVPESQRADLETLYRFRLHEDRGQDAPFEATVAEVARWLDFATWFLKKLEVAVHAYEASLYH